MGRPPKYGKVMTGAERQARSIARMRQALDAIDATHEHLGRLVESYEDKLMGIEVDAQRPETQMLLGLLAEIGRVEAWLGRVVSDVVLDPEILRELGHNIPKQK